MTEQQSGKKNRKKLHMQQNLTNKAETCIQNL